MFLGRSGKNVLKGEENHLWRLKKLNEKKLAMYSAEK